MAIQIRYRRSAAATSPALLGDLQEGDIRSSPLPEQGRHSGLRARRARTDLAASLEFCDKTLSRWHAKPFSSQPVTGSAPRREELFDFEA